MENEKQKSGKDRPGFLFALCTFAPLATMAIGILCIGVTTCIRLGYTGEADAPTTSKTDDPLFKLGVAAALPGIVILGLSLLLARQDAVRKRRSDARKKMGP